MEKEQLKQDFLQEETSKTPIIKPTFNAKMTAPFSIAVEVAMYRDKQVFLDMENNNSKSALVVYKTGKANIEILFKDFFKDMEKQEFTANSTANSLIRDNGNFNPFAEKVKDVFEEKLFMQYQTNGNVPIAVKDSELAQLFGKSQAYISKNIQPILQDFLNIQIRNYQPKKKNNKEQDFIGLNILQSALHKKGTTLIHFNDLYVEALIRYGFTQYPKFLKQTDDKKYRFAYSIGKYIAELYYYGRTDVKIKSLYERVTIIPRYEYVKKQNANYQERIYKPFEEALEYLNSFGVFKIEQVNTDYIKENGNYDFEKWLETSLIITWYDKPNYQKLNESRAKHRKLAEKNKLKNQT